VSSNPNILIIFQFEWAWQHPDKSRRLRHLPRKKKKETPFLYRFRVVSEMLRSGPWNRLAHIHVYMHLYIIHIIYWDRSGHDRMVVGFTTIYAISAYDH
jgi:hypothetical protein